MSYRRTKILINSRFQIKFAFFVCTLVFALSMVYPILIYNLFEMFLKTVSPDSVDLIRFKEIQSQVIVLLGVLQLVFLVMTFLICLFISHRIAGPLYKLGRALEEIRQGNLDLRIQFRKNDYFKELQDKFNDMAESLSSKK